MTRIRCSERIKEGLRRAEMTQADLCRLTRCVCVGGMCAAIHVSILVYC